MKRRRSAQLGVHRFALGLLGLLLVAGGAAAVLLTQDLVDQVTPWATADEPVLAAELDEAIAGDQRWFQVGALAVGVLLVLVGLAWLRNQLPPRRVHQDQDLAPSAGPVAGSNTVRGGALAAALEGELESHRTVESAVAEVRPEDGVLRLRLAVHDSVPAERLSAEVIDPAVQRSARVAGTDVPQVLTDVRLVEATRLVA